MKEIFCNRLSGFSSLACNGSRLARVMRKSNTVSGTSFEKRFDVAIGEKRLMSEEFCHKGGFCKLFNGFHSTEGSEKVGAGCHHAMIGHENSVVLRNESSERFASQACLVWRTQPEEHNRA